MFTRAPRKVIPTHTERAIELAEELTGMTRAELPPIYVVDQSCGVFKFKRTATVADKDTHTRLLVPLWAYEVDKLTGERPGYFRYYVAHELAHFKVWLNGTWFNYGTAQRREPHNEEFYQHLSAMLPAELLKYEYDYLETSAVKWLGPKRA